MSGRAAFCLAASVAFGTVAPRAWPASLEAATAAYDRRDFASAFAQFEQFARVGSARAQFNAGVMLIEGRGVRRDVPSGYAWLLAARAAGLPDAQSLIEQLERAATRQQRDTAEQFAMQYSRAAVRRRVLPQKLPTEHFPLDEHAHSIGSVQIDFPRQFLIEWYLGWVSAYVLVDSLGAVADWWISESAPDLVLDEAFRNWVIRAKFSAATRDGKPVSSMIRVVIPFDTLERRRGSRQDARVFVMATLAAAKANDPLDQYRAFAIARYFPEFRPEIGRPEQWLRRAADNRLPRALAEAGACRVLRQKHCDLGPPETAAELLYTAALAGEVQAQLLLGHLGSYEQSAEGDFRAVTWYGLAASGEDPRAQRYLAAMLATAPNSAVRDPEKAAQLINSLRRHVRLFGRDDVLQQAAAAVAASRGDFRHAKSLQTEARRLALLRGRDLRRFDERLDNYASGRVWTGYLIDQDFEWITDADWRRESRIEYCHDPPLSGSRIRRCVAPVSREGSD